MGMRGWHVGMPGGFFGGRAYNILRCTIFFTVRCSGSGGNSRGGASYPTSLYLDNANLHGSWAYLSKIFATIYIMYKRIHGRHQRLVGRSMSRAPKTGINPGTMCIRSFRSSVGIPKCYVRQCVTCYHLYQNGPAD